MNTTHFDVFLSHNSRDKAMVERLAAKLKRDGLEPWLDKWCLTPGGRWQDELVTGLHASDACAVFVGPNGLGDWVYEELGVALDRAAKDRKFRLFLVLLPGLPEPFDPTTLPPFLSTRTWVDLRPGIEDSRAYQHLINAIKGVPFGQQLPSEPNQDVCPYRGLQTFDEAHSDFFFGRENEIQRLIERLKGTRFLAVLGPSGSGKSSLVRAGLIPALRAGALPGANAWSFCIFTPSAHPLTALAAQLTRLYPGEAMHKTLDALAADQRTLHLATSLAMADRPAKERVVWVVDQFEELFTLCQDDAERTAFMENLIYAASLQDGRDVVLLTLRADFYQKCAAYPDLSARIAAQQFLVSPMDFAGLRRAIEEPAWRVNLEFEQGLVDTILEDIERQPGALPLLEHALLELWERRRGHMLTLEGYRQSGGVQGAIAKRADAIYDALSPDQQRIARLTLLRLTQPGEGTEDTRRRAALSELITRRTGTAEVDAVVSALVNARLLTTTEEGPTHEHMVEVSHEALIRGWPRLRGWLDEDRGGLRLQRRLSEAAEEWHRLGRDAGLLYRGARLAEALEWRKNHEDGMNDLEREFLDAGAALKQREEDDEREQQQRDLEAARKLATIERGRAEAAGALATSERRRSRIARRFSAGLAVLLVIAVVTTLVAVQQQSQATTARGVAEQQRNAALAEKKVADGQRSLAVAAQRVAQARALAANSVAQLPNDPELSLLLARAGVQQAPLPETVDALRQSLAESRVRLTLRGHAGIVFGARFNQQGTMILSAGADGTVRLWDARTGRPLEVLRGPIGDVGGTISPDGRVVATFGPDNHARLWDANTGKLRVLLTGHTDPVNSADFSPDGREVATASQDGTGRVWDVASGRQLLVLRGHAASVWSIKYSPDGREIVTGSGDGTGRLWDARTGRLIAVLSGHTDVVDGAGFSPNGLLVATISFDHTARLWDARTGHLLHVLGGVSGHHDWVIAAAFSPDSSALVTGSADTTAIIWNTASGAIAATLRGHTSRLFSVRYSPDGRYIVTASDDGTARVWTAAAGILLGSQVAVLHGQASGVVSATFSPDGTRIITAGKDGTVRVWDSGIGRLLATIPQSPECRRLGSISGNNYVIAVTYSRSGTYVATGDANCLAQVWDAGTGRLVANLSGHRDVVQCVAFSPDGRWLATGSADMTVRVWDTRTWRLATTLRGYQGSVNGVAFSPNGRLLVTAAADGALRLWQVGTWAASRVIVAHGDGFEAVALSPDGRWLVAPYFVSNGAGGKAGVWSLSTGKQVATLNGHTDAVDSAAFSPNGRYLVTGGQDSLAIVYDTAGWRQITVIREPAVQVITVITSVAFSPDNQWLLTGSEDGTARLWEVGTWRNLATLTGQPLFVMGVAFSPDEHTILAAGFGGMVRAYGCDVCGSLPSLEALAVTRSTRDFTADERKAYLSGGIGA